MVDARYRGHPRLDPRREQHAFKPGERIGADPAVELHVDTEMR